MIFILKSYSTDLQLPTIDLKAARRLAAAVHQTTTGWAFSCPLST